MKHAIVSFIGALVLCSTMAHADKASTEQEVRQAILDGNAYVTKNLKGRSDDYSSKGALEFWSSGGLLQEIPASGRPGEFESFNIDVKHIRVVSLVPDQVAMAYYYSEGSLKPKGDAAVSNYLTRVSQVYVKEDGKWKVRASHWSPVAGGSGTSQTAFVE